MTHAAILSADSITLVDPATNTITATLPIRPDYPTAAVWSSRAGHIALISRKRGAVAVHRLVDDTWHAAPRPPHDEVHAAAFTPDETTLLLARGTRVIRWPSSAARSKARSSRPARSTPSPLRPPIHALRSSTRTAP